MVKFLHPEYLYGLLVIPILIILFIIARNYKRKSLKLLGDTQLINKLMPEVSQRRPVVKFILLILTLMFLIFGIADLQIGSKLEKVKRKGVEVIIALDVSNSMLAEDIKPNRLERAKQAVEKLIDRLEDDKIGLIVFAGKAFIQLPITNDYISAKMFLSAINTSSVAVQGTAIGAAIQLGVNSFTSEEEKNRAIIVITDGENHEDNAVEIAAAAAQQGIVVHTLGMGLPQGAPIPEWTKYGQRDYKTDKDGNVIVSKLDETMLQQIAAAGGGMYIRATNTKVGLDNLFEAINKMNKKEFEAIIFSEYEHRFQYFLGIALFLLLVEFFILERKNILFEKINLFKTDFFYIKK